MNTTTVDSIAILINKPYRFKKGVNFKITINSYGEEILNKINETGITITVDNVQKVTKMVITSKILGCNFLDKISKDNIRVVYRLLNEFIDITYSDLLRSFACTVDATKDIYVDDLNVIMVGLFKLATLQTRYKPCKALYMSKGFPTSFWLKRDNSDREFIDYLSVYNKKNQLTSKGSQGGFYFLETLNTKDRNEVLLRAEGLLRFETKLSSRRMIRKHFKLPDRHIPTLYDILFSKVEINRNMVEAIFNVAVNTLAKPLNVKSISDLGYYHILSENDFCIQRATNYIKNTVGCTQKSRIVKKLKGILAGMEKSSNQELIETYNQILEKLSEG